MPVGTKTKSVSTPKMPTKLRLKLANEAKNLLDRAKIKPDLKMFNYHLIHSESVDSDTYAKLIILFESLMKDAYVNSSWGWDQVSKLKEWKHSKTRWIMVTRNESGDTADTISYGNLPPSDHEIIGFMCLRFEIGSDKSEAALYIYELHVHPEFQRQGLGSELMRMAGILAVEFKMDKMMLTVFRSNTSALKFYKQLNFNTDKSSPDKDESDYTILSRRV